MALEISFLTEENTPQFKADMQAAFQYGYEHWDEYTAPDDAGDDTPILPEQDIDDSLKSDGAMACQAVLDGALVGGAIYAADLTHRRGELLLLYVRVGSQNAGTGQSLWRWIEAQYPEITVWETVTPYHDKRNIHFYINRCGFSAVEFFNSQHRDPSTPDDMPGGDLYFRFEKRILRQDAGA